MRRVFAVCMLASAMMAGVMVGSPPAGGVAGFGDVDTGRFFTEPVQWMVDNDITTGTSPTCFSPDDPVTRGQAAAFMWRMEGFPAPGAPHGFSDVVAPWQQDPVSWMFNNAITTGTTATTYSPDENLTRGQLAALLHRLEGSPPAPSPAQFPDVVKSWQITPVGWMLANNITTGTSATTFSPEDTVTRGQLAAFFYRHKGSPPVVVDPSTPHCATGQVPTFTEYTTGAGSSPAGLAVGSVWVIDETSDKVLEIDEATGLVVATHDSCAPGFDLHAAITTGFGSVWFSPEVAAASVICELDTTTDVMTAHPLPAGTGPSRIFAGETYVWYSDFFSSKVGRLHPGTGVVVDFTPAGLGGPVGITTGFGSVWVADLSGDAVFRLDPSDGSVSDSWTGLAGPFGITTGAGSVWFTNSNNNALGEIDPASAVVTLNFDMTGTKPVEIVAGPPNLDGIWFTQINGPGGVGQGSLIGRYDPTTNQLVEYQTPTPASSPFGIAAGADAIWVAENATGKVLKIAS